jgi:asparagine synthase (glutamine-hydrolysing)
MCGIVGAKSVESFKLVSGHLNLLERRGPDSSGIIELSHGLTLGATRLAMTDPVERSNQPFVDAESGNAIIFNGEIYNYRSLKQTLLEKRVSFSTESDTEVILKSLLVYGPACISNLEGMFSFAYYDKKNESLILARDYLGKKPLYYSLTGNNLFFSSQVNVIKSFLKKVSLNFSSVTTYLSLGYVLDPSTMFDEILSVEPGEVLIFDLQNLKLEKRIKFIPKGISNPTGYNLNYTLSSAIEERIDGHNRFALSLSGGIDSNLLLMKCIEMGLNVEPFTVRWASPDKLRYNLDSETAIKVTRKLGLELNIVDVPSSANLHSILLDYVKSSSSPNSNPTAISMMYLYSEMKKQGLRLALTGDGSDEVFGGYPRYRLSNKSNLFPKLNCSFLKKLMISKNLNHGLISKFAYSLVPKESTESWLYWHLLANKSMIEKVFNYTSSFQVSISSNDLSSFFSKKSNGAKSIMFNDLKTWLTMESNRRLDSISMFYSIEARSPFQSENVIGNGYAEMEKTNFALVNKEILISAFPNISHLPINRNKMGFISPLGSWLRSNPDLIGNSLNNLKNYFDLNVKGIEFLSNSPNRGDYHNFKFLWSLIVLESWLDQHF